MLGGVEYLYRATRDCGGVDNTSGPSPGQGYLGRLKRELGIVRGQGRAWKCFAASVRAHSRRMSSPAGAADARSKDVADLAFGELPDRLAGMAAMQLAVGDLLAVLTPAQRRHAARLLPLCCLPAISRG
jgi:hypothetical protein